MCPEYVQCSIALEGLLTLVLARPGFPGKCLGEMGGNEWCLLWWVGGGGLTTLEGKGEGARVDSVWKSTQDNCGVFVL